MNISQFKQKYPQYSQVPNQELANALYQKLYAGSVSYNKFMQLVGEKGSSSPLADLNPQAPTVPIPTKDNVALRVFNSARGGAPLTPAKPVPSSFLDAFGNAAASSGREAFNFLERATTGIGAGVGRMIGDPVGGDILAKAKSNAALIEGQRRAIAAQQERANEEGKVGAFFGSAAAGLLAFGPQVLEGAVNAAEKSLSEGESYPEAIAKGYASVAISVAPLAFLHAPVGRTAKTVLTGVAGGESAAAQQALTGQPLNLKKVGENAAVMALFGAISKGIPKEAPKAPEAPIPKPQAPDLISHLVSLQKPQAPNVYLEVAKARKLGIPDNEVLDVVKSSSSPEEAAVKLAALNARGPTYVPNFTLSEPKSTKLLQAPIKPISETNIAVEVARAHKLGVPHEQVMKIIRSSPSWKEAAIKLGELNDKGKQYVPNFTIPESQKLLQAPISTEDLMNQLGKPDIYSGKSRLDLSLLKSNLGKVPKKVEGSSPLDSIIRRERLTSMKEINKALKVNEGQAVPKGEGLKKKAPIPKIIETPKSLDVQKEEAKAQALDFPAVNPKVAKPEHVKPAHITKPTTQVREGIDAYNYVKGEMGMTPSGSFTKDNARWMTFTANEVKFQENANKSPSGSTRKGTFIPTAKESHTPPLYSKGEGSGISAETIRSEIPKHLQSTFKALEDRGIVHIAEKPEDIPASKIASMKAKGTSDKVNAYWDGKALWLLGHNMSKGTALATVLHEGSHATMKGMLGARYSDLLAQYGRLFTLKDPIARRAEKRAVASGESGDRLDSERLAYLVQEATKGRSESPKAHALAGRILSALRQWFFKSPLFKVAARAGIHLKLQPKDFIGLTEVGLKKLSKGEVEGVKFKPRAVHDATQYSLTIEENKSVIAAAKDALAKGADIAAVHAVLKDGGIDPAVLGSKGKFEPSQVKGIKPIDPAPETHAKFTEQEKTPFTQTVIDGMKNVLLNWRKLFPSENTKGTKGFAAIIGKNLSDHDLRWARIEDTILKWRADFAKLGDAGMRKWINDFEHGDYSGIHAKELHAILEKRYTLETDAGATIPQRRNYFPLSIKQTPDFLVWVEKNYIKGAKGGFQKARLFPTREEAIAAGFKPKFPNPVDAVLARIEEGEYILTRLLTLKEAEGYGLIRPYIDGINEDQGELFKDFPEPRRPDEVKVRTDDFGEWLVPQEIEPFFENGVLNVDSFSSKTFGGSIFRFIMMFKQPVLTMRLTASAFHLTHELVDLRQSSGMAEAAKAFLGTKVTKESISRFAKSMMLQLMGVGETTPRTLLKMHVFLSGGIEHVSPFMRWVAGHYTPEKLKLNAFESTIAKLLIESGFKFKLSLEYRGDVVRNMREALQDGKWVKAGLELPFAVLRGIQVPIMDWVVPNLKLLAMIDGIRSMLRQHPEIMGYDLPRGTHDAGIERDIKERDLGRMIKMRSLMKGIDERFGQAAYDRIFWNKKFLSSMQLFFLSFTWQKGWIHQFGGAALDTARTLTGLAAHNEEGAHVTSRMVYSATYIMISALMGTLMTELVGGQPVKNWLDLFYPVVSYTPDGKPIRSSTPLFTRELVFYKRVELLGFWGALTRAVLNKGTPLIPLIDNQLKGSNYYGYQFVNPNASWNEQLWQRVKQAAEDVLPISFSGIERSLQKGMSVPKSLALNLSGFTPAPSAIENPLYVNEIGTLYRRYVAPSMHSFESNAKSQMYRNLRQLFNAGKAAGDLSALYRKESDLISQGKLTFGSVKRFNKGLYEPRGYYEFSRLPASVRLREFNKIPHKMQGKFFKGLSHQQRAALYQKGYRP